MIITYSLSFRFVENVEFQDVMVVACHRFKMLSRWVVARECFEFDVGNKEKLVRSLKLSCFIMAMTEN